MNSGPWELDARDNLREDRLRGEALCPIRKASGPHQPIAPKANVSKEPRTGNKVPVPDSKHEVMELANIVRETIVEEISGVHAFPHVRL